jgi:hypothetical protein
MDMSDNKVKIEEMVIDGVVMVPKGSETGTLIPVQEGTQGLWQIGKCYFIRTVTYHYTGRLVHVSDTELALEDVSWIGSSGRWSEALKTGKLAEVEPYPSGSVIIGRGAIVDASIWNHPLPLTTK